MAISKSRRRGVIVYALTISVRYRIHVHQTLIARVQYQFRKRREYYYKNKKY